MVMTVPAALRYAKESLIGVSDEENSEARLIVSNILGIEPSHLAFSEKTVDHCEIDKVIIRRKNGEPLQYIFGKWWFYKSEFLVGEGVLIPRQDTEHLVEAALELIEGQKEPKVADLCSGSGCIAISIALDRPDAEVLAVEKYDAACDWLNKNIEHNKASNVTALKADVLLKREEKFDLIVCNPPYIPVGEKETLSAEVLNEPHTALFGGEDGLYFYREITHIWKENLNDGGRLAFEVGFDEAEAVADILKAEGFSNIGTKTDLLGIERVVFGTVNGL